MSYKSVYTGPQVSTAVKYMTHPNVGTVLTYDSSANFPQHAANPANPSEDSLEGSYFRDSITGELTDSNGILISTKFVFVDSANNMMYRWKYQTRDQWLETHDTDTDYPADGYSYIACSGGGSGDLYWNTL